MNIDLKETLETYPRYFLQIYGTEKYDNGFKLSIQGTTLYDSEYLIDNVVPFLLENEITFKLATKRLIEHDNPIQSKKLLTIYAPNHVPITEFAEIVYKLMKDYTGGETVKQPESYAHYNNAIYYRNDRDENGQYIRANKS